MKRDEVMAMTDEQLRIKAAELTGWTKCADRGGDGVTGVPTKEWLDLHTEEFGPYGILKYIPDYPNDIAAAMNDLVPRIIDATYRSDGDADDIFAVCYFVNYCWGAPGEPWAARMVKEWCLNERHGGYFPIFTHIPGKIPAQAITRAFILAMEENHE